jgi:hypothetical protein
MYLYKYILKPILFFFLFQNGDGFISAKELGVLMRTLGRNPTEDEIMNIMNEIDVDHNGKLDFSEFTIMMRDKLSGEDMEQEIKQAFRYVLNPFACLKTIFLTGSETFECAKKNWTLF